jgi:hypothetical protein
MKKLTTEQFIKKAISKHGDKYSYEKTEYINAVTKLIVTCRVHGDFLVGTNNHLEVDGGCVPCALIKSSLKYRKDQDTFIEQAIKIHGDKYSYDQVEYVNTHTKVKIVCKRHGVFEQTPNKHISKKQQGCKKCKVFKDTEEYFKEMRDKFVEKSLIVYKGFYSYENFIYKDSRIKSYVTCPVHGDFLITVSSHIRGSGCVKCANLIRNFFTKTSFINNSKDVKASLYVIKCFNDSESFIKVGITSKHITNRFKNKTLMPYNYTVLHIIVGYPEDVWNLEKTNLKVLSKFSYTPKIKFQGMTECFYEDALKEIILKIK